MITELSAPLSYTSVCKCNWNTCSISEVVHRHVHFNRQRAGEELRDEKKHWYVIPPYTGTFRATHTHKLGERWNDTFHGAESLLRNQHVLRYTRNSPHFMESEGSLPHSQQHATCPYPDSDRSSQCPHPTSRKSILILSSHLRRPTDQPTNQPTSGSLVTGSQEEHTIAGHFFLN